LYATMPRPGLSATGSWSWPAIRSTEGCPDVNAVATIRPSADHCGVHRNSPPNGAGSAAVRRALAAWSAAGSWPLATGSAAAKASSSARTQRYVLGPSSRGWGHSGRLAIFRKLRSETPSSWADSRASSRKAMRTPGQRSVAGSGAKVSGTGRNKWRVQGCRWPFAARALVPGSVGGLMRRSAA
jgi:hypothetical protein